jgi:hypothetical protein
MDTMAADWTDELAEACERRFSSASEEAHKRLVWLLERAKAESAHAVLLRRLAASSGDEAARILGALNRERVAVPTEQILRLFDDATEEAAVASGISGDVTLAPRLAGLLRAKGTGRHAALALATLGRREFSGDIAARIETAQGIDAGGLIVALEVMNDRSVVPKLVELITRGKLDCAWDLHHALWRLTGREPFVRFAGNRHDAKCAYADAWRTFDFARAPRPRLDHVKVDGACASATFELLDGAGTLRIDYDPSSPGSQWGRWGKSLFASDQKLCEVGSDCGTCETTLRLTGSCPVAAAASATEIRRTLGDVADLDENLLTALEPLVTILRTGHYVAKLVDLDLERVTRPEDSWLTRRKRYRMVDGELVGDPSAVSWPGSEHFQVRDAALVGVPTYGVVLPTAALADLRSETVENWISAISSGARPAALTMSWIEEKDIHGEFTERCLVNVILDGHHKLSAYALLHRPARVLALCRVEDSWGPPDDRARWIGEAFRALGRW